jgi:hypothetical protein
MANQNVTAISMIIIRQVDIAAGVAFYQRLGFSLKFHLKDAWAELSLAGMRIGLCPTGESTNYRTGIVLQVDDLRAFYAFHKDQNIFLGEPKEALHGLMVSLKDPGGNSIDVYQPTPERVTELVKQTAQTSDDCCQREKTSSEPQGETPQCCRMKPSSAKPYSA